MNIDLGRKSVVRSFTILKHALQVEKKQVKVIYNAIYNESIRISNTPSKSTRWSISKKSDQVTWTKLLSWITFCIAHVMYVAHLSNKYSGYGRYSDPLKFFTLIHCSHFLKSFNLTIFPHHLQIDINLFISGTIHIFTTPSLESSCN